MREHLTVIDSLDSMDTFYKKSYGKRCKGMSFRKFFDTSSKSEWMDFLGAFLHD